MLQFSMIHHDRKFRKFFAESFRKSFDEGSGTVLSTRTTERDDIVIDFVVLGYLGQNFFEHRQHRLKEVLRKWLIQDIVLNRLV